MIYYIKDYKFLNLQVLSWCHDYWSLLKKMFSTIYSQTMVPHMFMNITGPWSIPLLTCCSKHFVLLFNGK